MERLYDYQKLKQQELGLQNPETQETNQVDIGTTNPLRVIHYDPTKDVQAMLAGQQNMETQRDPKVYNDSSWWDKSKGALGQGLTYGLMASPIIGNMLMTKNLEEPEKVNAGPITSELTPELVNRQQIERNLVNQLSGMKHAMQQSSSGDFGQYSANLQSLNASSSGALANATLQANLADAAEKSRVAQANINIKEMNANRQLQADEINAQNRAQYNAQKMALQQGNWQNIANIGQSLFNRKQALDVSEQYKRLYELLGIQGKNYGQKN